MAINRVFPRPHKHTAGEIDLYKVTRPPTPPSKPPTPVPATHPGDTMRLLTVDADPHDFQALLIGDQAIELIEPEEAVVVARIIGAAQGDTLNQREWDVYRQILARGRQVPQP